MFLPSLQRPERELTPASLRALAVKILQSRGVAFVTYVSELNAQFAKEAMMCQSLDDPEEVINVRCAFSPPTALPPD